MSDERPREEKSEKELLIELLEGQDSLRESLSEFMQREEDMMQGMYDDSAQARRHTMARSRRA